MTEWTLVDVPMASEEDHVANGPKVEKADDKDKKVTRVSIALETDATGSLKRYVQRMKDVFGTLLAVCKEVREENEEIVFDITIGAMRDWDCMNKVYELFLNKVSSIKAGHVVPFPFSGTDEEYATILAAIDRLANEGCFGGGDDPEEYFAGIAVAREFFRKQRERYGVHPQFALFCADDAHHGFCDIDSDIKSKDSLMQGTGHMPTVNHEVYKCPYAPTKNSTNEAMWLGGNAMAELGKMLDEGVYTVWCAVGNAAKIGGPYNKWLTALTSCMEKTDERTGFVFRYDLANLSPQDMLKVPSTIATLFLQHVKCLSVPSMENAVKREDLIRGQVSATLEATADRIRREGNVPSEAVAVLTNGMDTLVDNLDILAVLSSLEHNETLALAEAAESEHPGAMRTLGAKFRSLQASPLSNPTAYLTRSPNLEAAKESRPAFGGLKKMPVPGGVPSCRTLSASGDVPSYRNLSASGDVPSYRGLHAPDASVMDVMSPPTCNDPKIDRKAKLRSALCRHVSHGPASD